MKKKLCICQLMWFQGWQCWLGGQPQLHGFHEFETHFHLVL